MKKLVDIINLPQLRECQQLQTEFHIQRKNLQRYQDSLSRFRARVEENVKQNSNIEKILLTMHMRQSKGKKKTSEIEYHMYHGVKVFNNLTAVFGKMAAFYGELLKRISNVGGRVERCLSQHKTKLAKLQQHHQREVKKYANECYPETATLMFMIGMVDTKKMHKIADTLRETALIEQAGRYAGFLEGCLQEMEQLRVEIMAIAEDFYEGARDVWLYETYNFRSEIEMFNVDQEQVNKIADETGRVLTDRSNKSNGAISGDESDKNPGRSEQLENELQNQQV